MAKEDTDYNPAIRKEIKADAETGRSFKKWKHRAQGAAVGTAIGTVAGVLAGRKLRRALSAEEAFVSFTVRDSRSGKITNFGHRDMASILGVTEFKDKQLRAIQKEGSDDLKANGIGAGIGAGVGLYASRGPGKQHIKEKKLVAGKDGILHPRVPIKDTLKAWGPHIKAKGRAALIGASIGGLTGSAISEHRRNKADQRVGRNIRYGRNMASILGTTNLSVGAFREMVESAEKLKKLHVKKWKEMDPKMRDAERKDLRIHRQALSDVENASSDYPTYYSSTEQTTDMDCGVERHPGDLPMDPATLKRKKLNAGQTGPQSPLMPQDPIKKITSSNGKMHFSDRRTFFAADANGRPHSSAGTFQPEVDGVTSQQVQRAYNPKTRLTGITPGKGLVKRQIMRRALARVGATTDL
jgi:hypothetical protein